MSLFRVVESRALPHPGELVPISETRSFEEACAFLSELVHDATGRQFAIMDENGEMVVDESGEHVV